MGRHPIVGRLERTYYGLHHFLYFHDDYDETIGKGFLNKTFQHKIKQTDNFQKLSVYVSSDYICL
ncbi:MAG: hypothetical protein PHU66_05125 [Bacteroidaceae bacterium]|nr:hypothetical protein [Bacteroidaceae bacterium]